MRQPGYSAAYLYYLSIDPLIDPAILQMSNVGLAACFLIPQ